MATETATATDVQTLRDKMRAEIFSAEQAKIKSEVVEFFGQKIEVRQTTLGQTLEAQSNPDREAAVIDVLINRAYIPGTNTRVFEDTDAEQLKNMPFGIDFVRVSQALETLTGVNFRDMAKSLEAKPKDDDDNAGSVGTEDTGE